MAVLSPCLRHASRTLRAVATPFRATRGVARRPLVSAAKQGDFVTLDYNVSLEGGEVVASSAGAGNTQLQFIVGELRVLKGLDRVVAGMEVGASQQGIRLAPAEAYGEVDPSLVLEAPRPPRTQFSVGEKVTVGGQAARIVAADDKTVTVDLNPELAGKPVVADVTLAALTPAEQLQKATFGAGCFWGVELAFQRVPGVLKTEVGYSNGEVDDPTYEQVCSGSTGHAEVVQVVYDSSAVAYSSLLDVFWKRHDPTTLNRQGGDVGTQYRSGIYYHTEEQQQEAEQSLAAAQSQFRGKIVTEIAAIGKYYPAEEYHQQYLSKGGRFSNPQSPAKGCTDPIRCYG